jgi:hypothetical protein
MCVSRECALNFLHSVSSVVGFLQKFLTLPRALEWMSCRIRMDELLDSYRNPSTSTFLQNVKVLVQ